MNTAQRTQKISFVLGKDERAVLIVIDMQNGFLGEKSAHVIEPVQKLVDAWIKSGRDVVFSRFFNQPDSLYESLIGWTSLRSEQETKIHKTLLPYANCVVDKVSYTVFTPFFEALLSKHGWDSLFICGVSTDICVLKTAADTFDRGLIPVVIEDACASDAGEEVHQMGIHILSRFIGERQIADVQSVIEFLN